MKNIVLRLTTACLIATTIGVAYLSWAAPASTDKLRLGLSIKNTSIRVNEDIDARISITNEGNRPVTLVMPGDGSESGWRTPVTRWIVSEMNNDNKQAPTPARDDPILRCGNINPLSLNEVFILYPGKTREFSDWLYHPVMKKAGVYRVAFSYANVPSMEWAGVPLGIHNPLAMLRVRQSTRCELESNEVILTVK